MTKKVVLSFLLMLTAASAFSPEFSIRPGGFVFFPAGPGNKAAGAVFRTTTFWTSTLGFDTTKWSFTYLADKGYPFLKNVGGQ
jgi:hypothetical protein